MGLDINKSANDVSALWPEVIWTTAAPSLNKIILALVSWDYILDLTVQMPYFPPQPVLNRLSYWALITREWRHRCGGNRSTHVVTFMITLWLIVLCWADGQIVRQLYVASGFLIYIFCSSSYSALTHYVQLWCCELFETPRPTMSLGHPQWPVLTSQGEEMCHHYSPLRQHWLALLSLMHELSLCVCVCVSRIKVW